MISDRHKLSHGFQITLARKPFEKTKTDEKGNVKTYYSRSELLEKDETGNLKIRVTRYVRAPNIRSVVFKGGGGRAWVYKKLLDKLNETGAIECVEEFGGSSAGSIFAAHAAVPYLPDDPDKDNLKFYEAKDAVSDSKWGTLYKVITSPLYLISKPLEYLSDFFGWMGGNLNKVTPLQIIGVPLNFVSGILSFGSAITHPDIFAIVYNLITLGSIFRGEKLHNNIRDSLAENTRRALEQFLNRIKQSKKRDAIIRKLEKIPGLIESITIEEKSNKAEVKLATKDINFSHFHALRKIRGSGFKDIFVVASNKKELYKTRSEPKADGLSSVRIFNHQSKPNTAVHNAIWMTIAAPTLFPSVKDVETGEEYVDGGCANNFPIQHASTKKTMSKFEEKRQRGVNKQDLDVLGARVEYKEEMHFLHMPKKVKSWWEKLKSKVNKFVYRVLTGVDIISSDKKINHLTKQQYSQRTLQIYDHDLGFTEFHIEKHRKQKAFNEEEKRINNYFKLHEGELVSVENFKFSLSELDKLKKNVMPIHMQKKLYNFLLKTKDEDVFADMPSVSRKLLRADLLRVLKNNIAGSEYDAAMSSKKESKHNPHEKKERKSNQVSVRASSSTSAMFSKTKLSSGSEVKRSPDLSSQTLAIAPVSDKSLELDFSYRRMQ